MVLAFMGSGGVAVFVHSDGEVDQPQPKKSIVNCASNAIQSLSSQGKLSCIVVCHLAAFLSAVPCILQFLWQCQVMHILRACIDASALLLFAVKPSPNPIPKLCMAEDPLYCSSTLSWVQGVPNKPL
uniref:Uncharacterized protein n=1 Tax=Eutreptiella gymnastica TaxID=73025 RepID=A0A6T2D9C5_9EUGL